MEEFKDFYIEIDEDLEKDLQVARDATGLTLNQLINVMFRGETDISADSENETSHKLLVRGNKETLELLEAAARKALEDKNTNRKDGSQFQKPSDYPNTQIIKNLLESDNTKSVFETFFAGSIALVLVIILGGIVLWNVKRVFIK